MLNDQVIGLLQNNAGNPDIVRRIAEENQLSQAEIAQALRIPEGSAARYMPAMGERQVLNQVGQPSRQQEPAAPVQEPSMGGVKPGVMPQKPGQMLEGFPGAPGLPSAVGGGMVNPAPMPTPMPTPMATKPGMQPPQVPTVGAAPAAGSAGGMAAAPAAPAAAPSAAMAQSMQKPMGIPPAGQMADAGMVKPEMGTTKPAKLPADMKPQGMMGMRGQMRRPNTTALPGDEEFQRAFDRIRGARA